MSKIKLLVAAASTALLLGTLTWINLRNLDKPQEVTQLVAPIRPNDVYTKDNDPWCISPRYVVLAVGDGFVLLGSENYNIRPKAYSMEYYFYRTSSYRTQEFVKDTHMCPVKYGNTTYANPSLKPITIYNNHVYLPTEK